MKDRGIKSTIVARGKVNVNFNLFVRDVEIAMNKIVSGLSSFKDEVRIGKYNWALRKTRIETIDGAQYLCGRLGKAGTRDVPKMTEADFEYEPFENYAVAWLNFLLNPGTELVVFEEKTPHISAVAFCRHLTMMIEHAVPDLKGLITINPLPEKRAFLDFLLEARRVLRVGFEITPANGDIVNWEAIEQEIARTRSTMIRKEYISNAPEGLAVPGTDIEGLCRYVDQGWATAQATVELINGRTVRRSTKKGIKRIRVEYEDGTELIFPLAALSRSSNDNEG